MNGCIMLQSLGQFMLNYWSFTLKETGDEETQDIVPCDRSHKRFQYLMIGQLIGLAPDGIFQCSGKVWKTLRQQRMT
jgi:hypothetical protein